MAVNYRINLVTQCPGCGQWFEFALHSDHKCEWPLLESGIMTTPTDVAGEPEFKLFLPAFGLIVKFCN